MPLAIVWQKPPHQCMMVANNTADKVREGGQGEGKGDAPKKVQNILAFSGFLKYYKNILNQYFDNFFKLKL